MRRLILCAAVLAFASIAGAFLISNNRGGGGNLIFEQVSVNSLPLLFKVDIDPVLGVTDPLQVTEDLMDRWNAPPTARDLFDTPVSSGVSYVGANAMVAFGRFGDGQREVAWDADGSIMIAYGVDPGILGITIKSVDPGSGNIRDVLVVVNTSPFALSGNGTREELFRATLIHELGHVGGLGHSPVGIANTENGFGLERASASEMPSMFAFRLPSQPAQGGTLEEDDRAALAHVYPLNSGTLGSLSGSVRSISGLGINEIAVRAVSEDGTRHVGRLTDADASGQGTFFIPKLQPGGYRVVLETVNGRANIDGQSLAGSGDGLGANPFLFAADEYWQPGDTYDPALDAAGSSIVVQVRAGRETGSLDFVLNGAPLFSGDSVAAALDFSDARLPDGNGDFRFVDYYVFTGTAGQTATIDGVSAAFTPQLTLLTPSDLTVEAVHSPLGGTTAQIVQTLQETGIYTIVIGARDDTGSISGRGNYSIDLNGAGAGLPPAPANNPAVAVLGPAHPGDKEFQSPICDQSTLQVRLTAPSLEELWVDDVTVRLAGSGDDLADIDRLELVHDRNGNGRRDGSEPILASLSPTANDQTVTFMNIGLQVDPGDSEDLLLSYDVTVNSVMSAGPSAGWFGLLLLPGLFLLRRLEPRRLAAALLLAVGLLAPLSCGGGGGGGGNCNRAFDPAGAIVDFTAEIRAGDIQAYTPTMDPTGPGLNLPAATLGSSLLRASN